MLPRSRPQRNPGPPEEEVPARAERLPDRRQAGEHAFSDPDTIIQRNRGPALVARPGVAERAVSGGSFIMRWEDGRESENVEDQRRAPVGLVLGGAGTIIVIVIALVLGKNPMALLQQVQNNAPPVARAPRRRAPKRPARSASSSTCWPRPRTSGRVVPAHGKVVSPAQARALHRPGPLGVRTGRCGCRAVLLPRGRKGVYRPGVLRRVEAAVPRPRRFRQRLRDRARGRPSRAEPAGHQHRIETSATAQRVAEPALRAAGTPGRFSRRHLGLSGPTRR